MSSMNQQRDGAAAIPQLRAEIDLLPKDRAGKRRGIPEDLRRRIIASLAVSELPLGEFARALSLSSPTISNWRRRLPKRSRVPRKPKARSPGGFKKMTVVSEPEAPVARFTIEGPNGIRVTGLGSDDVARLWRELC